LALYWASLCADIDLSDVDYVRPKFYEMPKPASKLSRLVTVCLCLVGLALVFLLFRCAKNARASAQNARIAIPSFAARLTMVNDSNCEWIITATLVGEGEEGQTWKLQIGKSLEVVLAGGEYRLEQRMLSLESGSSQVRRFPMKFEAKQNYRWRLVSLLSGDEKMGLGSSREVDHE